MCMCYENECKCKNKILRIIKNKEKPVKEKKEKSNIEFRINFGKRLVSARKMKVLSLEEAGKLFMISKQALNRYELGKVEVTSEMMIKFSKVYELPVDYFLKISPEIIFGKIKWCKLKIF